MPETPENVAPPLSEEALAEMAARFAALFPGSHVQRAVAELRRAREFAQRVIDDERMCAGEMSLDDYQAKYGPGSHEELMAPLAAALLPPEEVSDAR